MGDIEVARRLAVILAIGMLLAAILAFRPLKNFIDSDICLDRGGAWKKQTGTCVGILNTYSDRH